MHQGAAAIDLTGINLAREAEVTIAVEALQRRFGKRVVKRVEMAVPGR
jgi:hypothetical protein